MGTITIYSRFTPTWSPGPYIYYAERLSLAAGNTTIAFAPALAPGTGYNVKWTAWNANREQVGCEIPDATKTDHNFVVSAMEACTFEFEVIIRG